MIMHRAVAYIRVSTNGQAKDGNSLENQKLQIMRYAKLKEFDIIETVVDSKSAKDMNRPGMKQVLQMAKNKAIDAVIISKLDRGFRSVSDALETAKQLDKLNIGLHSVCEMVDTKSAMGRFFFVIMAGAAELERNRLSERMLDVFTLKRARGEKCGNWLRFGYDRGRGKKLKENPAEQKIIKKIVSLHEVGRKNKSEICRYLNMKNITTKNGKLWNVQQIKNIIRYNKEG